MHRSVQVRHQEKVVIWHYRHHQVNLVTPFNSFFALVAAVGAIHPCGDGQSRI